MKLPKIDEVIIKTLKIKDLKILHLSDLHINKKTSSFVIKELVSKCNRTQCDFIVITGDIIDCKVKFIKEKLQLLNNLEQKTYYISGNHDLFYGFKELKEVLTNLICLDNSYEILKIKIKILQSQD